MCDVVDLESLFVPSLSPKGEDRLRDLIAAWAAIPTMPDEMPA